MKSQTDPLRCIVINGAADQTVLDSLMVLANHMIKCGLEEVLSPTEENDGIEIKILSDLRVAVIGSEVGTHFTALVTDRSGQSKYIDYFIIALPAGVMSYCGRWITDYCEEFYQMLKRNSEGLLLTREHGSN